LIAMASGACDLPIRTSLLDAHEGQREESHIDPLRRDKARGAAW
jgi:hypothetical protein